MPLILVLEYIHCKKFIYEGQLESNASILDLNKLFDINILFFQIM